MILHGIDLDQFGHEYDQIGRALFDGVKEGLWPWKPEKIELYNDFDFEYNWYRIEAAAQVCGWWVRYTGRVERDDILDGHEWVEKLRAEFLQAFRNREPYHIRKNIVLGEN